MSVWISSFSILIFIISVFYWIYDHKRNREKLVVTIIALSSIMTILSLTFIAKPDDYSHSEVMLLFILFFVSVFLFLTLAEEDKLRVILFGSVFAVLLSVLFLYQILPLNNLDEHLASLTDEQIKNLFISEQNLHELAEKPYEFFEIVVFSSYIEWEVIAIVFGMSLLVAVLTETGLFDMVSIRTIKTSEGVPKTLLILVFFLTLILSAILDNTTAIILVSSITITVTRGLNLNPKPYILAEVSATVTAGIATVIGSLPGILIAGAGDITFLTFSMVNLVFLILAIIISLLYLFFVFKKDLEPSENSVDTSSLKYLDEWSVVDNNKNLYLGTSALLIVVVGLIISNSIGLSVGFIALAGAILAVVLTRTDLESILHKVELESILFFIGLFILVGTLEISGALEELAKAMKDLAGGDPIFFLIIMVIIGSLLSAIVDNIPVTIMMAEVVNIMLDDPIFSNLTLFGHPIGGLLWFTLLYAVTFGGGLTPFGTVTGVIGVQVLSQEGKPISFMDFVKTMAPLATILLILGFFYLLILQFLGILPALYA